MVERSKINITAMANANSALIVANAGLQAEIDRLRKALEKAQARVAEVQGENRRLTMLNEPKAKLTSFTGRLNPKSELMLRGLPTFEMFIGDKGQSVRIMVDDPALAEDFRKIDPKVITVVSCEVNYVGMKAIAIGTVRAKFVIENTEQLKPKKGETEPADGVVVKTYAVRRNGERVKILSLPDEGLALKRLGDEVVLDGVFRSYQIKGKYYPFFLTTARLQQDIEKRQSKTVVVGKDYVAPENDDGPVPF